MNFGFILGFYLLQIYMGTDLTWLLKKSYKIAFYLGNNCFKNRFFCGKEACKGLKGWVIPGIQHIRLQQDQY